MADILERGVGRFHPKCISCVVLSEDKRVASGKSLSYCYVSSNEAIPIGVQFSVKILQTSSSVSPISASFRPHPSDAPLSLHGWRCCLFFVYCDGIEGTYIAWFAQRAGDSVE